MLIRAGKAGGPLEAGKKGISLAAHPGPSGPEGVTNSKTERIRTYRYNKWKRAPNSSS